jgi:hypothetical protein
MHSEIFSLNLQRGAEHLHAIGPRGIAEFLKEYMRIVDGHSEGIQLLNAYRSRLTPDMMRFVGADRFPPSFRVVPREEAS